MNYQTFDFPEIFTGTTFAGHDITLSINGAPKNITGATINMYINEKVWSTLTGEIEIIDAVNGVCRVMANKTIDLIAYNHPYYIQHVFSDGTKKVYIKGHWPIVNK